MIEQVFVDQLHHQYLPLDAEIRFFFATWDRDRRQLARQRKQMERTAARKQTKQTIDNARKYHVFSTVSCCCGSICCH